MTHERRCPHCGYWTHTDLWDEDETVIAVHGTGTVAIIRSVACPGCCSITDPLSAELRPIAHNLGG